MQVTVDVTCHKHCFCSKLEINEELKREKLTTKIVKIFEIISRNCSKE